jgi:hypothetical protein
VVERERRSRGRERCMCTPMKCTTAAAASFSVSSHCRNISQSRKGKTRTQKGASNVQRWRCGSLYVSLARNHHHCFFTARIGEIVGNRWDSPFDSQMLVGHDPCPHGKKGTTHTMPTLVFFGGHSSDLLATCTPCVSRTYWWCVCVCARCG